MDTRETKSISNQQEQHLTCGGRITNNGNAYYHISANDHQEMVQNHAHLPNKQPIAAGYHRRVVIYVMVAALALILLFGVVIYDKALSVGPRFMSTSEIIRKSRSLFDSSDQMNLYRNHSTFQLLAKIQSSGAQSCTNDQKNCPVTLPCKANMDQTDSCKCPVGYYKQDQQCRACTLCGHTQYPAAPCSSQDDTICIDVSFPVGILPMNKSYLPDDGRPVAVTHSSNVFIERLINMDALETPMYVTNNQQSLDFVWPRPSGLDIAVSVSGVYLVPDYEDVEAVDDTALFHRLLDPSQKIKSYYNYIQGHYCRHPVPDYYSIQLEIIRNRTSTAQVIRCDSQDELVPRCPAQYKDGDRYLKWNINTPCPSFMTTKLNALKDGPNSVVCTDETDLLRQLFKKVRPTTQEYMFSSRECELRRKQCELCFKSATCPVNSVKTNDSYLEDNQCCGIRCYTETSCKRSYSNSCPLPTVECATGEVNIFSLFPHFDSMDRQFSCHIKYVPPHQLYSVRYVIKVPTINFNTTSNQFTVFTNSRSDHERRLSQFDFITAFHDTRVQIADELILIGDQNELKNHQESLMKPYKIRELKAPSDLRKEKPLDKNPSPKAVFVQFEKPFLYSSFSWYRDGCYKNMSQIYANQTIYKDDFTPVIARKGHIQVSPETTLLRPQGFTYRLYHRDRAPYIKFVVEKGKTVLQHLQGKSAKGKLMASSLVASVTWHNETAKWKIALSATQDECPTVISIKIFTQFYIANAGHFDVLINCPLDFTVEFNFSSELNKLPNIFVLQINDSTTTHNMILSTLFSSVYNSNANSKECGQLQTKPSSPGSNNGQIRIWITIVLILVFTFLLLVANCVCLKYMNLKTKCCSHGTSGNYEGQLYEKQEEKVNTHFRLFKSVHSKRCFTVLFVLLYILYSLVFSFTLGFGLVYLTQSSIWSNITNLDLHKQMFTDEFKKSLEDIKRFEENEKIKLLESFNEKKDACISHLKNENRKQILHYEATTKKQVESIFEETGKAYLFTREIQRNNVSVYLNHIRDFLLECNKTVTSLVERFQANFYHFVHSTAHNDWLKVPRQIFLYQDGEDPEMKYLSSTQVKQFASWLEIDKAEELFVAKDNVFGRLSSLQTPEVSTLDTTFPFAKPRIELGLPEKDEANTSYFYTVLGPLFPNVENLGDFQAGADNPITKTMSRAESNIEEFSRNQRHFLNRDTFQYDPREELVSINKDNKQSDIDYNFEKSPNIDSDKGVLRDSDNIDEYNFDNGVNYDTSLEVSNLDAKDNLHVVDFNFMNDQTETSTSKLKLGYQSVTQASTSEDESRNTNNQHFYFLIATFLIFDVVLWFHRISWLRNELRTLRKGYPEKVPDDDICKQLLQIQFAHCLPSAEESSRYFLPANDPVYGPGSEAGVIFLKDLRTKKTKNETLQDIWTEKIHIENDPAKKQSQKRGWRRSYTEVKRNLRFIFQSNLIWQGSVTFICILLVCMIVYYIELWFTPEHLRAVARGRSPAADIQWHVTTSDRYLQLLTTWMTVRLQQIKELSDSEVQLLTDMYFKTLNTQTSMFTAILQKLCKEAKGSNCEKIIANYSEGERIVGCNFTPLEARTIRDVNLPDIEAMIAAEITPKMNLFHQTLIVSASVLIFLLCSRLVCQVTASLLKHFLLLTGRLPRLRIHQSEKVQIHVSEVHGTTMQRSQSWVDSCESGVYLGETEETNKEDNR